MKSPKPSCLSLRCYGRSCKTFPPAPCSFPLHPPTPQLQPSPWPTTSQGSYLFFKLFSLFHLPRIAINQEAIGRIHFAQHSVPEHVQHCLLLCSTGAPEPSLPAPLDLSSCWPTQAALFPGACESQQAPSPGLGFSEPPSSLEGSETWAHSSYRPSGPLPSPSPGVREETD